jgi:hypothetical protein
MPVNPLPCDDGGTTTPVEVTTCCAPSIASAPLCRADGTTVLAVVRSGCVECGQAAQDPTVVGWLDTAGTFTPGPLPADVGPCEAGCVDTICRQLCDDTDGDGQADTTYSELWCIRADGSAELVLTYQDDPSQPYTPVAPVECTYGCPESETVQLCDDGGPFLRRYTWLNGTASYEDVALDGQTPHVVTGTVRACSTDTPCAEQTTPTATLGLCLADGTPIAVILTRDCSGTVTRDGWIDLTSGTYSTGAPPPGAQACGDSRAFELAGLLCDTDPTTGDVLGLVLVEYAYNADGSLASVRLVDPATGNTYTLQGELRRCPGGEDTATADQDLVILCDVQADGTSTEFVRDYRRDPVTGLVTGHTDYALDGTPYTPTGTAGACTPEAEPCRNSTTLLVCDLPTGGTPAATATDTDPTPYYPYPTAAPVAGAQTLWDGGTLTLPPGTGPQPGTTGSVNSLAATLQAPRPACDNGTAHVTVTLNVQQTGPDNGCGPTGHLRLFTGTTQTALTVLPAGTPAGYFGTLTVEADVPAAELAAGNVAFALALDAYDDTAACTPSPRRTGWTLSAFTATVDYDQTGCATQFLRTVTVDCETGTVLTSRDTTLDGQPYTVTGEPGQCQPTGGAGTPTEPCRNTSSLLVCDLPTGGTPTPTVTDVTNTATPYEGSGLGATPVTAGAAALWSGGTLTIPATDNGPGPDHVNQHLRSFAATIQADRPGCDTGTATVTASIRVQRTGPNDALGGNGLWDLWVSGTRVAFDRTEQNAAVGYTETLTATAEVPAADLAAGNVTVSGALETWQTTAHVGGWIVDRFTVTTAYDQTGCATQFLRSVTVDCDGAVIAVTDTTMDGQPYTVVGEVGQCEASGGSCCPEQPCGDTELAQLCDLTYDPQAPIPTPAGDFALTGNVVAANDGTTLWFAQANQEANGVAELTVGGLLPATLYEFRFASAWVGAGNPTPATNNAIYLLEILDGATALASRTRNVSNGSNAFPGGVLTEDMPPLAFTAPPSGAVTIRFTDQTTGGPVNDRDLYLMPLEVRTAVLTLSSTPFLRRFTYDCDGNLTSTQDLALDGTTPYVVQGEAGVCTADGGAAGAATPCDVQNVIEACRCDDADGDGIADTDYLELLGVDCEGVLTSLGTYTPDLTAPYTPTSPVACDAGEDLGAPPAYGVQAHRVELAAGASWSADAWPTLQSITAVAHNGTGTITTADGTSTLHTGEAATWSVARDEDARLTGPLTIAADTGTVTITYTTGVQL